MRIDSVGTTADFRCPGPHHPLPLNHLLGKNRGTAGRIGEVGLIPVAERIKVFGNLGDVLALLDYEHRQQSIYVSKFIAAASGLFDAALNYLWDERLWTLAMIVHWTLSRVGSR